MAKPNVPKRSISPLLVMLRDFMLGREHNASLRFSQEVATRSPSLPILPDGPSHQLAANYYFKRDGRREVKPPIVLASKQLQIAEAETPVAPKKKPPTPGNLYLWD